MTRLVALATLLAGTAACETLDRNPCDRYADFICDCYGTTSAACRDVSTLADDPTADVQDQCEIDLATEQDTAECLDDTGAFDTGAGDTGVTWWGDTGLW